MKKLIIITVSLLTFCSCDSESSSDQKMAEQTEQSMQEMNRQIGMPAITKFQERKLAKMIFEERDRADLITYVYLFNQFQGNLVYLGKAIGYGLPYSIQYTNPERIADYYPQGGFAILPQADPNGLFMPTGLSATWLMMIDEETGKPRPVYFEPEIIVSPFPLHHAETETK